MKHISKMRNFLVCISLCLSFVIAACGPEDNVLGTETNTSISSTSDNNSTAEAADWGILDSLYYDMGGFEYDSSQGIFYSDVECWQRSFGYCALYDNAARFAGCDIVWKKIKFKYDNKYWMIELWKGIYGITTGSEIGIYYRKWYYFPPGWYKCADNSNLLQMSSRLYSDINTYREKRLFTRSARHWWLTGFKPAVTIPASRLTMYASITLKNTKMRNAFRTALGKTGTSYSTSGLTVSFWW